MISMKIKYMFYDIEEICKGWFATVYLAIWKDGPLCYNLKEKKHLRESDKTVTLKYFNFSQNNGINEFLNEAKNYSIRKDNLSKDKIYGISQKPNTNDYILVLYNEYSQEYFKECYVKYNKVFGCEKIFTNWISGNEKVDGLIQEMQSKINIYGDILFEWIPYNQFSDIEKVGRGGFATVYSAKWKDGPLRYHKDKNEWIRNSDKKVALKCLGNSQNITNEFLNEVKAYSTNNFDSPGKIIGVYGISQNTNTKEYIIVLQYAEDMGLCGEIDDIDEKNIYGVMPYVAPEVLRGKPYTQAADIYSFGMVMYFVATERQPFASFAHDELLALDICKGIRPEINEPEAPKCYIDLMKKCWDTNPDDRLNAAIIEEFIISFYNSYRSQDDEIKKQFQEAEKYRSTNKNRKSTIHPQAIYTSRLLNPFTKDLNDSNTAECLDCEIKSNNTYVTS
ncbi:kinase-like domain-containing protein [Rhizophagus clarus]|uniref:Kinase-like domain-containing protein n=1 Tax=Rhizophagus clarus TaxID=94130 RepID=A0A8H3MD25_9GLOM|nr:kinase-like domain-containing protein [Rhizophagus clarus]